MSVDDGPRNNVVQPPDPGCMTRVGTTTTYTNCSIDFGRFTWNGTLTASGNDITVDMHFVDQPQHTREFTGTITVTSSSLGGSLATVSNQPSGIITYHTETTLQFAVGLQSRCGRSGTMHEIYDSKTLVNTTVAVHKEGDFTATSRRLTDRRAGKWRSTSAGRSRCRAGCAGWSFVQTSHVARREPSTLRV